MHPMLTTAVKAARRASGIIQRASNDLDLISVERKSHNDYVTEVDRAAEQAIVETLAEAYPGHAILAEEGSGSSDKDSEYQWVIDPLDGTTNFLHGFPQYSISIALLYRGVVTQAVVYDPNRNDLFTASKGGGAFLNNRRIRVGKHLYLRDALIGTGFPYTDFAHLDTYLAIFRDLLQQTAGLRRPGSAALDLAYVAAGYYDAFFELGLHAWDIAAGALLIQEAGGLVSDFDGNETYLHTGNIVAGSPKIFGQLLKAIAPYWRAGAAA